jgi:hypothetical protein
MLKMFEVEFMYNDYEDQESAGQCGDKNQLRVRIPFPPNETYDNTNWSVNHQLIRKEFRRMHDKGESLADNKYWIRNIRRVK